MRAVHFAQIEIDPEFGIAVIAGTAIPVLSILVRLAHGYSENEIVERFPVVTVEQIVACRDFGLTRARNARASRMRGFTRPLGIATS